MAVWTEDELDRIGRADELHVAGMRKDGSLRNSVTIWVVRLGDEIYIRSVNGPTAAWYRGSQIRGEGRIEAGGVTKDVSFVRIADRDDDIDAAYLAKYGSGSSAQAMITDLARSTTLRVDPR